MEGAANQRKLPCKASPGGRNQTAGAASIMGSPKALGRLQKSIKQHCQKRISLVGQSLTGRASTWLVNYTILHQTQAPNISSDQLHQQDKREVFEISLRIVALCKSLGPLAAPLNASKVPPLWQRRRKHHTPHHHMQGLATRTLDPFETTIQ